MPIHPNVRRCGFIRLNGKSCGSPAVTGAPYCHFHCDVSRRRREVKVPMLGNAADIQQGISEVIRGLLEGRIDRPRANTILYALQLAQNGLAANSVRDYCKDETVPPSLVQTVLDQIQTVEEFEKQREAEEKALAEEEALIRADVRNIPKRTMTPPDPDRPHHWTDDIKQDDEGYLKLTKEQEEHLDRLVKGEPEPKKTG